MQKGLMSLEAMLALTLTILIVASFPAPREKPNNLVKTNQLSNDLLISWSYRETGLIEMQKEAKEIFGKKAEVFIGKPEAILWKSFIVSKITRFKNGKIEEITLIINQDN